MTETANTIGLLHTCMNEAGWSPYTYVTPDKQVIEYDTDIPPNTLKKHKLNLVADSLPWNGCLQLVKHANKYKVTLSLACRQECHCT